MSRGDRAVRLACHAIVLVWIAAFLGHRALSPREVRVPLGATALAAPPPEPPAAEPPPPEPEEATPEPAEPEETPEIGEPEAPEESELAEEESPAPEENVTPEPRELAGAVPEAPDAPEPPADPAPPREPAPLAVDETDVVRGGALLAGEAPFPALQSRYQGYGSFREYAAAMRSLGARFVVVSRREILGTIDPWTLETGELDAPAALSPRARDYAGEPELARAARSVRRAHGLRAEVMMLVPRRLDAALFGGIARALESSGREPGAYREIRARYERGPDGGIRLRIESAVRRDGSEEPLPLLFDLGRLAGSGRA